MAAKAKKKASKDKPVELPNSTPSPVPPAVTDRRADEEAVLGQFVDVVAGENEGIYGVFIELIDGVAVIRSRDNDAARYTADPADLRPAQSGRR